MRKKEKGNKEASSFLQAPSTPSQAPKSPSQTPLKPFSSTFQALLQPPWSHSPISPLLNFRLALQALFKPLDPFKNFQACFKPFSSTFRTLLKPPSNLSEAPLKPFWSPNRPPWSPLHLEAPFKSFWNPLKPFWSPLQPLWSPIYLKATFNPFSSPPWTLLKPFWSRPLEAVLKPFKPSSKPSPSSPLQALLKPLWSPSQAALKPLLKPPLKLPWRPSQSPSKPPSSPWTRFTGLSPTGDLLVTGGQVNLSLCLSCWPVLVGLVFVFVVFCFVVTFDLFCFCFVSFDLIGIVMTSLDCVSGLLRHRIPGEAKNRKKKIFGSFLVSADHGHSENTRAFEAKTGPSHGTIFSIQGIHFLTPFLIRLLGTGVQNWTPQQIFFPSNASWLPPGRSQRRLNVTHCLNSFLEAVTFPSSQKVGCSWPDQCTVQIAATMPEEPNKENRSTG